MTSTKISIMTLGIAKTGISVWSIATTLKEGQKALEETKKENLDNWILPFIQIPRKFWKKIWILSPKIIPPLFSGGDNKHSSDQLSATFY